MTWWIPVTDTLLAVGSGSTFLKIGMVPDKGSLLEGGVLLLSRVAFTPDGFTVVPFPTGLTNAANTFELSVICFGFWIIAAESCPSRLDDALETIVWVLGGMLTLKRLGLEVGSLGA